MGGSELEIENDVCTKSAAQPQLDAISSYNDLDLGASSTQSTEAKPQPVKHPHKNASSMSPPYLNLSNASLAESSTYPVSHQYHYIQYFQPPLQRSGGTPATCHCHCTCRSHLPHSTSQQLPQQHCAIATSGNIDGQMEMAVSVLVHQSSAGASGSSNAGTNKHSASTTQSSSHSYQALLAQNAKPNEDKPSNLICNCEQECNCAAAIPPKKRPQFGNHVIKPDTVSGADEITVSESDNNSTIRKKRKGREGVLSSIKSNSWCAHNHAHPVDYYSDGIVESLGNAIEEMRPPLPPRPRPPPRPRSIEVTNNSNHRRVTTGIKKYVVWCLICGGFSCLLGILFLGVYFLLHSYTITVGNFETVPTFVPATLLILTGVCIMSLARRKNRYSYLIKLSGACGLISALTCALVTVTTTVLHMSRLQSLRECEYAQKTRTCTCYSDLLDSQVDRVDKGVRLVFDSLSDCGVVHGSLYSCLRAIFGLSVAGVLIAVFSCMLVYQLLSHERKKMYWEQLELRCRSLYTSQQGRPSTMGGASGAICRCCEQCHAHRQLPIRGSTYPWDDGGEPPRFWASQPPGNFYSPNPGGDDLHANTAAMCRAHCTSQTRSRTTGWSWPRMPWQRSSPDAQTRFRQTPSSPDSQYGFSNNMSMVQQLVTENGPPNTGQHFNIVPGGNAYGVWGPPPPYSDPNSPARRNYYQYIQQSSCNNSEALNTRAVSNPNASQHQSCGTVQHSAIIAEQFGGGNCCAPNASLRNSDKRDYRNTPSDSDGGPRDRFSNTLPTRKLKKRTETGAKIVGMHSPQTGPRLNVRQVFPKTNHRGPLHETQNSSSSDNTNLVDINEARQEARNNRYQNTTCDQSNQQHHNRDDSILHQNDSGTEKQNKEQDSCDPAESEVYFADVSSCCNVSVKNDNYYEDASQETLVPPGHQSEPDSMSNTHFECFQDTKQNMRCESFASDCNIDNNQPHNIPKELSHQSMCSVLSEPKTEFTDLSPSTPCTNKQLMANFSNDTNDTVATDLDANSIKQIERLRPPPNFVASLPYSSESQCLEAHRRSTKNMQETLLTPEAHYEVINDSSSLAISPKIRNHSSNSSSGSSQRANHFGRCHERIHKNHQKSKTREQAKDTLPNPLTAQIQRPTQWSDLNGKHNRQCL